MNPEDTPLTRVLAALSAPAHDAELAGRDRARAAFREAMAAPPPATGRDDVNKSTLARLLTLKTGVAVLCATAVGGVALAAGGNPLSGDGGGPGMGEQVPVHRPKSASGAPAGTGPGTTPSPSPAAVPPGRLTSLCVRILKAVDTDARDPKRPGKGEPGRLKDKVRFKPRDKAVFAALVRAAGGEDEVLAYCADLVPGHSPRPGKPGKPGKPGVPGKPGQGANPGKPSNTAHPAGGPGQHRS